MPGRQRTPTPFRFEREERRSEPGVQATTVLLVLACLAFAAIQN
jgi:hypothetical protein